MSESNSMPVPFAPLPKDWEAEAAERRKHEAKIREINRTAIFDALQAAGLETVVVSFDGYGDSGQIENIEAQGEKPELLQSTEWQLASLPWGKTEPDYAPVTLEKAVEDLVFAFLGDLHGGWEDHEGSYGEATFDVAARSITLDFNERYVAANSYQYAL